MLIASCWDDFGEIAAVRDLTNCDGAVGFIASAEHAGVLDLASTRFSKSPSNDFNPCVWQGVSTNTSGFLLHWLVDGTSTELGVESTQAELALFFENKAASMLLQLSAPFSVPNRSFRL